MNQLAPLSPSPYVPVVGRTQASDTTSSASASGSGGTALRSTVTLSDSAGSAEGATYATNGLLGASTASGRPVWERAATDAATHATNLAMAANANAGDLRTRWSGLGRALLDGMGNGGGNYSQSVLVSNEAIQGSNGVQAILRDQLHRFAANSVSLNVTTVGGAHIALGLSSDDAGIAVQVKVLDGQLDDEARAALARLGDAFQAAIDGLARQPPQLAFDGLMQFDSTQLSTLELKADLGHGDTEIDLHLGADQRTLSTRGAAGAMQVAVDVGNTSMVGGAAQQQRAIASYLAQVDDAVARGHGNQDLAGLFKQGFAQLNSHLPARAGNLASTSSAAPGVTIGSLERQLLTGLADFKASFTQTSTSPNPRHLDERDKFDYQVSQQTSTSGHGQADRSIVQHQQSSLQAAYHEALQPDLPLKLTSDDDSQNYTYHQIDDQASSNMAIDYRRGYLARAQLSQAASQDTRISKFIKAQLMQDRHMPVQSAIVRDFAAQLQQGLAAGHDRRTDTQARWRQLLQQIGATALLQADPGRLKANVLSGPAAPD